MNIINCEQTKGKESWLIMDDRKNIPQNNNVVQNLILENREKLTITGVVDVLSFDDQIVIVETQGFGLLTIKGEDLRINKLSLDTSEVIVDGEISSLTYSQKVPEKNGGTSLLSKIFK